MFMMISTAIHSQMAFKFPLLTCYVIITAVAVVGNFIVCCTILADRNLRNNPTTLFLLSLAFSDLVMVTVVAPIDIEVFFIQGDWLHGEIMCEIWSTVFLVTVPASILTLLAVSIDRYKSLSDPLNKFRRTRFMTRKKALMIIFLIWTYSVVFASVPLMGWRTHPGESAIYQGICWFPYTKTYTSLTCFLNYILPLLVTCGIYIKIYRIAHERNKSVTVARCKCGQLTFTQETNSYLGNLKAAKTISMFVGVFFFCWVPYSTYIIIISLCKECDEMIPLEAYPFLLMLGYLNSALNPFLFAFQSKSFKNIYSKILRSVVRKAQPKVKVRRGSTISQLTLTSEIPDTMDSGIWLRAIKIQQQESPDNNNDERSVLDVSL
ncbi:hypothetical protein ACROYT_G003209 [Oculina patagonica]